MSAQFVPVTPGNLNVVALPPPLLSFVILWPAFRPPPAQSLVPRAGVTGAIQNHWHYRPGVLHVDAEPVHWSPQEQFTAATYPYDGYYGGLLLPNVDVDLFRPSASVDFNDYPTLRRLYSSAPPVDPSAVVAPRILPLKSQPGTPSESLVGSSTTDSKGRVSFSGVAAGDYVLYLRGRLSFIENASQGGPASSAADRHNAVAVGAIADLKGRPAQALKIVVDAQRNVTAFLLTTDAQGKKSTTPIAIARYLEPDDSPPSVSPSSPYGLYVLPLVSASNPEQWRSAVQSAASAFAVTEKQAQAALSQTPALDLAALHGWECGPMPLIRQEAAVEGLLKSTLLVSGTPPFTTVAYDHAVWSFRPASTTGKTRASWLPLGETGFYSGQNALYALSEKAKDSYGRFSLRRLDPPLEGRDVRELKTRLVLWGSKAQFVDLRDDRFEQALSEALVRFKHNEELFRLRVDDANGSPDPAKSVITAIVDAETYRMLDDDVPSCALAEVADKQDDASISHAPLLTEQGYCRLILFAADHALARIAPQSSINIHSSFRTLAHNRRVYLHAPNHLYWRLATNAGPTAVPHHPSWPQPTMEGVEGADGSTHHAGDPVTSATLLPDEPRGTYYGQSAAVFAPDYSQHTTGKAFDFDLGRTGTAQQKEAQTQRDTNAIILFGASRGGHKPGRLWLEQAKTPNNSTGTTNWIHLDNGDLPGDRDEFALTDEEVRGPRWDASLIVAGTVTMGGSPRLGAKLELLDGVGVVATAYADRLGRYSLRARGVAPDAGAFSVRASFTPNYPYQRPVPDASEVVADPVPVAFSLAGGEVKGVDLQLPDVAQSAAIKGVRYARVGARTSILVTCAGWDAQGMGTDASIAWAYALQQTALPEVGHVFAVRGPKLAPPQSSYPEIDLQALAARLQELCGGFGDASARLFVVAHSSGSYVAHALFGKLLPNAAAADRVVYCNLDGGTKGLDDAKILLLRSAFAVSTVRESPPPALEAKNHADMVALGRKFADQGRGTFVPSNSGAMVTAQGTPFTLHYSLINATRAAQHDRRVYLSCDATNVTSDYVIFAARKPAQGTEVPGMSVPA